MYTFLISILILLLGYNIYGRIVDKVFGVKECKTPAFTKQDNVDYVPLSSWKTFLIQFLNIAGTGPIFGALLGATFGPSVFLWIVFGSIFAGAVHDYFCGMISLRHNGISFTELINIYLGKSASYVLKIVSIVLLLLVGTVFITSPAALLDIITPSFLGYQFWIIIILIYYVLSSIFPIDKIISKIYPFFAFILLTSGILLLVALFNSGIRIPEFSMDAMYNANSKLPVWPFLFVSVACGAISGFHLTQSPMMARCLKKEKDGRMVFYGAMIAEAVVALIWALLGSSLFEASDLYNLIETTSPSNVSYIISTTLLKRVGGIIAICSVVICPISSGDTVFRSIRLIIADWLKIRKQNKKVRILLMIPFLLISYLLTFLNFDILWRYFSWTNQVLACFGLYAFTTYLVKYAKRRFYSLITFIPAILLTAVCSTYILMSDEGLKLPNNISYTIGGYITIMIICIYLKCIYFNKKRIDMIENIEIIDEIDNQQL